MRTVTRSFSSFIRILFLKSYTTDPNPTWPKSSGSDRIWVHNTGIRIPYSECGYPKPSVADPGCSSRIPDSNFSIPDTGSKRFPDPGSASAAKSLSTLTQKIVSTSEIWFGMFIPDPDLDFLLIPDAEVKKSTESRIRIRNTADTDTEHWFRCLRKRRWG